MKKIGVVSIIGVGLIGGSIGMALRKRRIAKKVVGIGRDPIKLKKARVLGAIDEGYNNFEKGLKSAEIVVVATPVGLIPEMIKRAIPHLEKGSIITDVGSVKNSLVRKIERFLPKGIYFVGAHPIAGSEATGVKNADPDLFRGTYCILTPTATINKKAVNLIKKLWEGIGAKVLLLSPQKHDKILAFTSHLPHILAVSLVEAIYRLNEKYKNIENFIAGGFRDTTRIASSSAILWRDICLANKKEILNATRIFKSTISEIENLILKKKWDALLRKLNKVKKERDLLVCKRSW